MLTIILAAAWRGTCFGDVAARLLVVRQRHCIHADEVPQRHAPGTFGVYIVVMSELAKLYDVLKSATVAQVLAFAALIFPGLVALRAYEAKRGGEPRKTNEVLVDILGYSLIADAHR